MRMVKDYRVVGLPLGGSGCGLHDFYLKVHRDNKTATDRTLFVGNVDYGLKRSVEEIGFYLRHLFEVFGDVEGVSVSEFKSSFSTTSSNETGIEGSSEESFDLRARFAHILFCKRASLKAALKSDDVIYFDRAEALLKGDLSSHFNPPSQKTALRLICEKLRWVDCNPEELKHEVDEYMLRFEEMEDMERKTLEKKAKQADEEGFVLVTSK